MHLRVKMMKSFVFGLFTFCCVTSIYAIDLGRVNVSELFYTKLEPSMFNWTLGLPQHFQYRPSLKNFPDLPSWMRYMYSNEYNAGYLYGTPPIHIAGQQVGNIYFYFRVEMRYEITIHFFYIPMYPDIIRCSGTE